MITERLSLDAFLRTNPSFEQASCFTTRAGVVVVAGPSGRTYRLRDRPTAFLVHPTGVYRFRDLPAGGRSAKAWSRLLRRAAREAVSGGSGAARVRTGPK